MMQMPGDKNGKKKISFRAGKVLGFAVSSNIFVSIFYMLLRFFDRIPAFIQYWHAVIFLLVAYAIGLVVWGRKKWFRETIYLTERTAFRTFLSAFKEGFQSFGHGVASAVNTVLLSITYLIAVGLTNVAAKAAKKEFLELSKKADRTYWEELDLKKKDMEDYYRQF